ncbi:MAG TPA: succinylglutamate desuccinylase/aspartoacylase family protein [Rhodanobacteraceae bacterium]
MGNAGNFYPIGTAGVPWQDAEISAWRNRLRRTRYYQDDVLGALSELWSEFDSEQYGQLDYGAYVYPLFGLKSKHWDEALPVLVVTGGTHGNETSGVRGALGFARDHAKAYAGRANVVVVPCVNPWGYEFLQRWDPLAEDPCRSCSDTAAAPEGVALWRFLSAWSQQVLVHVDLHETSATDGTEFGAAAAARAGKTSHEPEGAADGFYVCACPGDPRLDFQRAVVDAVAAVAPIATVYGNHACAGFRPVARGVIQCPDDRTAWCAAATKPRVATLTHVCRASASGPAGAPDDCDRTQALAVCAAFDYALSQGR